jgi:hypothetical protein
MRVRFPGFLSPSVEKDCDVRTDRPRASTVKPLDNSPRLTPNQQAPLVAQLHKYEFREPDLSSDLLGAGLWIAYAVLAGVWLRGVAKRRTLRWLLAVQRRVVAPMVARQTVRGLAIVTRQNRRARILSEPATVRI